MDALNPSEVHLSQIRTWLLESLADYVEGKLLTEQETNKTMWPKYINSLSLSTASYENNTMGACVIASVSIIIIRPFSDNTNFLARSLVLRFLRWLGDRAWNLITII